MEQNCIVIFSRLGYVVQNLETGKVITKGHKVGIMFQLSMSKTPHHACYSSATKGDITNLNKSWYLWHHLLGHPHAQKLSTMSQYYIHLNKKS